MWIFLTCFWSSISMHCSPNPIWWQFVPGLIFLLQWIAAFYLYVVNYEHYLKTPLVWTLGMTGVIQAVTAACSLVWQACFFFFPPRTGRSCCVLGVLDCTNLRMVLTRHLQIHAWCSRSGLHRHVRQVSAQFHGKQHTKIGWAWKLKRFSMRLIKMFEKDAKSVLNCPFFASWAQVTSLLSRTASLPCCWLSSISTTTEKTDLKMPNTSWKAWLWAIMFLKTFCGIQVDVLPVP